MAERKRIVSARDLSEEQRELLGTLDPKDPQDLRRGAQEFNRRFPSCLPLRWVEVRRFATNIQRYRRRNGNSGFLIVFFPKKSRPIKRKPR